MFESKGDILLRSSGVFHRNSRNHTIDDIFINTLSNSIIKLYNVFDEIFERTSRKPISSYALKHMLEGLPSIPYVSNGELILVAYSKNCKLSYSNSINVDVYVKPKIDLEAMKDILNTITPYSVPSPLSINSDSLDPQPL
jgi:hypothetical protein